MFSLSLSLYIYIYIERERESTFEMATWRFRRESPVSSSPHSCPIRRSYIIYVINHYIIVSCQIWIYIYMCIYIYMYMCIYVCICIYIYIYIYTYQYLTQWYYSTNAIMTLRIKLDVRFDMYHLCYGIVCYVIVWCSMLYYIRLHHMCVCMCVYIYIYMIDVFVY